MRKRRKRCCCCWRWWSRWPCRADWVAVRPEMRRRVNPERAPRSRVPSVPWAEREARCEASRRRGRPVRPRHPRRFSTPPSPCRPSRKTLRAQLSPFCTVTNGRTHASCLHEARTGRTVNETAASFGRLQVAPRNSNGAQEIALMSLERATSQSVNQKRHWRRARPEATFRPMSTVTSRGRSMDSTELNHGVVPQDKRSESLGSVSSSNQNPV